MTEQIDDAIARIIETLKQTGQYDNTLIVYTTDHGELLGDHGLWNKGPFHYEQAIRVPLIIKWPQQKYKGAQIDAIVSLVDIAPTVMATCGVDIEGEADGKDLALLASGEKNKLHDFVMLHHVDDPEKIRLKTVVTKRHKLTFYYGDYAFGELYDLQNDPWEIKNEWNNEAMQGIKAELLSLFIKHSERLERRETRKYYV
jgi:uncharacterized sulfatase